MFTFVLMIDELHKGQVSKSAEKDIRRWYVLSANYRKEIDVRDELRGLGYEAYVPLQTVLVNNKGNKHPILKPAVHALVFVHASMDELFEYKHTSINNPYVFFRSTRSNGSWKPIVVREADMRNFMRFTTMQEVEMKYFRLEELRIAKGQKVKILDGMFKDIIGTVQKLPHKRGDFLVVEIPGVTIVAARIKPDFVQPIDAEVTPSTDVGGDVKRLDQIAMTLLYDLPDVSSNEAVRIPLIAEMATIRRALEKSKTFMPADKAAYALAHFLSAVVQGESTETWADTLRTVLPKLRTMSLLRLRASIYMSLCCHDAVATQFVTDTIEQWDPADLTEPRRQLLVEKHRAEKRKW